MTIQEAIQKIHMISSAYSHNKEEQEALSMAVKALKDQEQKDKWKILTYLLFIAEIAGFCLIGGIAAGLGVMLVFGA